MKRTTLLLALVLFGAYPAQAINCQGWDRLYEDQKVPTVYALIDDAVASSRGSSMHFNRAAAARCLDRKAEEISYAFDDACATRRTAGMQALNNIFKNYIWSCAG